MVAALAALPFVVFDTEPVAQQPSLAAWSAAVGFLLPFAIGIVNQVHWPARWKAVSAFAICLVAAAATTYFDGASFDAGHFAESALIVFTLARASYAGLWRPTGVVPAIEAKTTVTQPPPP